MKKILARLAQADSDDLPNSHSSPSGNLNRHYASFLGRHFRIGHFSLIVDEIIAEGGFGVVFRVRSQQGQYYALKRTCVNCERDLALCKRELTIVSSLSHKNILRYIDSRINRVREGIFEVLLLTAYYPGSLSQLLNERNQYQQRFTEVEVLRIFCDLCEAVCRLHHCKTPIIHRDLKVENILVDARQNFVLCDFGSATSRVLHPTVHGLVRCQEEIDKYTTLAYRAPELINLYLAVPLGPQIDIWALGCLLYCLCFAALPFGESTLAIQSGNYSLPDWSPYSEHLHKLIGHLLNVDAAKRPDIYVTCSLAFSLSGQPNPAQNLNNLTVPDWQDLVVPPRESELKASRSRPAATNCSRPSPLRSPAQSPHMGHRDTNDFPIAANTSVAPRQRPKAVFQPIVPPPNSLINGEQSAVVSLKPPPPISNRTNNAVPAASHHPISEALELRAPVHPSPLLEQNQEQFQPFWEADFTERSTRSSQIQRPSNSLTTTVDTVDVLPPLIVHSRGHHRNWSVDVGCMLRTALPMNVTYADPASRVYSRQKPWSIGNHYSATEQLSNPLSSDLTCGILSGSGTDGNSWVPFSPQLRHVQSLVSLPTSANTLTDTLLSRPSVTSKVAAPSCTFQPQPDNHTLGPESKELTK
ncbi:hypothetical protein P879_05925 [Paragonimus westermani]|uniref:non-specific serine/threonine protein kinase n=1 Tax=Paragonimus westermani TaxID=34504 RepID=A0A8T0DSS7_9TREM|nr:hypothetical protein P879_05925 [Paragonimus westermani]